MMTIVIQVDAPPGQAIGLKEHLAMCLERYGDTRVVEIRETGAEQMRIGGGKTPSTAMGVSGLTRRGRMGPDTAAQWSGPRTITPCPA